MLPSLLTLALLASPLTPAAKAAEWPALETAPLQRSAEGRADAVVIVAIEDYMDVDDIPGARANAQGWFRYMQARGVPPSRIFQALDRDAKDLQIRELAKRAAGAVQPGGTLWFVFIGHGAATKDGQDALLVGVDADRSAQGIYQRSVTRSELLALLETGPQAQTVAVLDACFSGQSGSGQALVAGLQPLIPTALESQASSRARVLTAAGSGEFSGPLPGTARPAFSYLALGGLMGWADVDGVGNGDGSVSALEVREYVAGALNATLRGRRQTPELIGADAPLAKAVERKAPDLLAIVSVPSGGSGGTGGAGADDLVQAVLRGKQREMQLTALVAAKQTEATAAWRRLANVLGDGRPEEFAAVHKFVETWKDAKVWVDDADGRHERPVVVGALEEAQAWLTQAQKGPEGRDWTSATLGTMKWIPEVVRWSGSESDVSRIGVSIGGFWMMEHEVTQGEWQAVVGSNAARQPDSTCGGEVNKAGPGANEPVYCVSWDEAVKFAQGASARDGVAYALPTRYEWEHAARGGGTGIYAGFKDLEKVAWTTDNSGGRTHLVCQKARNGYGLCDMRGNVREWVEDDTIIVLSEEAPTSTGLNVDEFFCLNALGDHQTTDDPSGPRHTAFSDSWSFSSADHCLLPAGTRSTDIGLRLVRRVR